GTHLGRPRSQNAKGHVLGHVCDLGLSAGDPNVRIYQTHERQTFHTDSADLVGLLCLQTARTGGLSALVSSITLYNELRARRSDLAAQLFKPLATDRRGEVPPGAKPYFEIPVFNWHEDRLSTIYQRQYINSAQRFEDAPRLTSAQIEALDLLDGLTNDPALHFTMALQKGDLQFVHNHTLLHDRTAFEDWPEPERRRHLLRLWLAPDEARALPPAYAQRFGTVEVGHRGGVPSVDGRLRAPLDLPR
ncbi:MAG: TauD/TfdA family dioxygenase, partial [Rhodanobacteraceae bacterium]